MNHSEATALRAAEKYFLGELIPEERDAFEVHFFSCTDCAAELQALYAVKETIRRMPAEVR